MPDATSTDQRQQDRSATPEGTRRTVYPCLRYDDAPRALADLADVLGFEVVARYDTEDGQVAHAEVQLSGGMVMVSSGGGDIGLAASRPGQPTAACVYVAVDPGELAAVDRRVRAAGWQVVRPLADAEQGPTLTCRDPQGVVWSLGTYRP
ncbi:VOC family protein [Thalassiella azotivora]